MDAFSVDHCGTSLRVTSPIRYYLPLYFSRFHSVGSLIMNHKDYILPKYAERCNTYTVRKCLPGTNFVFKDIGILCNNKQN